MLPFYVYILKCSDNSYYSGHTDNLEKRLAEHQEGNASLYTSTRLPVVLVYTSEMPSRTEALEMERRIKRWTRRKKEALIQKDWQKLRDLSKKVFK